MKRLILIACGLGAGAGLMAESPSDAERAVREAVRSLNPQVVIESVRPAPVAGWQEVNVGGQIVYLSNDGKYLMQGMLFDVASKTDLTEASRVAIRLKEMATSPRSDHIVFSPKDKAKWNVKVFTDVDCGFCQRMHAQIDDYLKRGIEIEYIQWPRGGIGSDHYRKAVAVWCATDRQKAITDAKLGKDPGNATCPNPIEKQFNLGLKIGVSGTPALVFEDGSMQPGYLPPDQLLARLQEMDAQKNAGK